MSLPEAVFQNVPNKAALAAAVHKRLGGVQKKKRLSRLKRIILRERASKAVEAATATLEAARAHVEQATITQGSIQAQLQVRCVPQLGNCLIVQDSPGCCLSAPASGMVVATGDNCLIVHGS